MRLDTFGTIGDFIIHVIAVSWQTVPWIIPIGLFWLYVIYPHMSWPIFLYYFLTCFFTSRYLFTPFLFYLHSFYPLPVWYIFHLTFSIFFLFFYFALFDFFQTFEKNQIKHQIILQLFLEEEKTIESHINSPLFDNLLNKIIPFFFCLSFFIHVR